MAGTQSPTPSVSIGVWRQPKEVYVGLGTILLIVLIVLLIAAVPRWRHSRSWGYGPTGLLGVVLIVVLILALTGTLHW
jgi:hypothetical protein